MSDATQTDPNVITIVDPATGTSAKILTSVGFNCFSFNPVIDKTPFNVIWAEPEFGEQSALALNGIPILFPFAGRLQGDSFDFEGQNFTVTGAFSADGNVIHGFVISRPWRVIHQSESIVTGEFVASIDDPSLLAQWPSDFGIRVTYTVQGASLLCDVHIENPGTGRLPFGFGTHPYFRIPVVNETKSDPLITVPAGEVWTHNGPLPTGKREVVAGNADLRSGVSISNLAFDGVLTDLLEEADGLAHTRLIDEKSGLRVDQTFSPVFRNCVIYVPSHREAVAIEPWSCLPNAFALQSAGVETGLDILEPGESWATRISITASRGEVTN